MDCCVQGSALRCRSGWVAVLAAVVACAGGSARAAQEHTAEGRVEMSDGTCHAGRLSLAPGQSLRLHVGATLKTLALDEVEEITFQPEREELERKWRFVEAGRTEKEYDGDPYPVRELAASLLLRDGGTLTGHLYTAALYVERPEGNLKIVLPTKQRGEPGETLNSLVYPVRVSCRAEASVSATPVTMRVEPPGPGEPVELAGLTLDELVRLPGRPAGEPNQFTLPSPLGRRVFVAVCAGAAITVGWPQCDEEAARRVQSALANVRDFFDNRTLLAAWKDPASDNVYSLLMLRRSGETTLGGAASQPWRLGVWRWKQGSDERLLLAGRGYLFRGILPVGAEPPAVEVSTGMWEREVNVKE